MRQPEPYLLTPVEPCTKCSHRPATWSALLVATFPAWFNGYECADETACIARRVIAGHRLPLPGVEPRVGLS